MNNRLLRLSVASLVIFAVPGLAPYAHAARILARPAVPAKAWRPALANLTVRLNEHPHLDPKGSLRRTLQEAQVELALDPSAEKILALTSQLPEGLRQDPSILLNIASAEQAQAFEKDLKPAVGALLDFARERGPRASDVAAAELSVFFDVAGRIAARHLGVERLQDARSREEARSLVQAKLAPYAANFLARARRGETVRGAVSGAAARSILLDHAEAFGGSSAAGLRGPLRKLGVWSEFVAASSLAAMEEAQRFAGPALALAGADDNLRLAIPSWHPLASSYATVAEALKDGRSAPEDAIVRTGAPLFSAFGIQVRAQSNFLVALILSTLGLTGLLRDAVPGLAEPAYVVLGPIMSLSFYACLVAHEFGHALVARRFGIRTRVILMHLLGGMAVIDREPRRAWPEFVFAAAGPLVSLALAAGFFFLGAALPPYAELLAHFFLMLCVLNAFAAVFNLLPAFPMDGGRLLRAALTGLLKDHYKATKIAGAIGQGFAYLALAWGIIELGQGHFGGLGMILLGFFLRSAARQGSRHPGTDLIEPKG